MKRAAVIAMIVILQAATFGYGIAVGRWEWAPFPAVQTVYRAAFSPQAADAAQVAPEHHVATQPFPASDDPPEVEPTEDAAILPPGGTVSATVAVGGRPNATTVAPPDPAAEPLPPLTPQEVALAAAVNDTSISGLIRFNDTANATSVRAMLVGSIWPQGFPTRRPDIVTRGIIDEAYANMTGLASVDRFDIIMEHGIGSVSYLFHPDAPNGVLLVYHQGHGESFLRGRDTIAHFVERGYLVLAFSMPLATFPFPTVPIQGLGTITLMTHDQLEWLARPGFNPISLYVEPVAVTLNYVETTMKPNLTVMMGLSGGGWTTTLYAALDERIDRSYPVAGSLPLHLRQAFEWGDYEQTTPTLYAHANYLELYALGSLGEGRAQVQILNRYDTCCFGGTLATTYEAPLQAKLGEIGPGSFRVVVDESHVGHVISPLALDIIEDDIAGQSRQ